MGQMFAMRCDLCNEIQVKDNAYDLKGSTYAENGVQKFRCSKCAAILKAAFEIKKDGLKNPMKKVAGLIEQRDKAERQRDEALAALAGEHPFADTFIRDPNNSLRKLAGLQPGQSVPVIGMGKPPEDRFRPELPDRPRKNKDEDTEEQDGKDSGKKGKGK